MAVQTKAIIKSGKYVLANAAHTRHCASGEVVLGVAGMA